MAYLGTSPNTGENRKLDDISGSFNGSTTTFDLQVDSTDVYPGAATSLLISVGGVVQEPTTAYSLHSSGKQVTFSTAPATGEDFFGVVLGQAIDVATPSDDSVTTSKIADNAVTAIKLADPLGFANVSGNVSIGRSLAVGYTDGRVPQANLDVKGNTYISGDTTVGGDIIVAAGSAGNPSVALVSNENTGMYKVGTNRIGFTTGGSHALGIGSGTDGGDVDIAGDIVFTTASHGVYLGVTSATAANLLDDYEEGTWTPTFVSTSATFAYTTQGGTYTKVGRIVTASFRLQLSGAPGGTTTNSCFVGGLPFATGTLADTYHGGHQGVYFNINLTQTGTVAYQLSSGSSTVELKNIGDNIGETAVLASALGAAAQIRGQLVYQTA